MITVSIISHEHAEKINPLLEDLSRCPEISHVVLTYNIPEHDIIIPAKLRDSTTVVHNTCPKGFGTNHNAAFKRSATRYFCVLNPDVRFADNPFPPLIASLDDQCIALVAPAVVNPLGNIEDSVRKFPTPFGIVLKIFHVSIGQYKYSFNNTLLPVEWVAGIFMLFRSKEYSSYDGFDEGYYLYYEDVDICVRIWNTGKQVCVLPSVVIIHSAHRSSHKKIGFFRWHLCSMIRYFLKHTGRLPDITIKNCPE